MAWASELGLQAKLGFAGAAGLERKNCACAGVGRGETWRMRSVPLGRCTDMFLKVATPTAIPIPTPISIPIPIKAPMPIPIYPYLSERYG